MFSAAVIYRFDYYVYFLQDPRTTGNLSNLMGGHYSSDYGLKFVEDIFARYEEFLDTHKTNTLERYTIK